MLTMSALSSKPLKIETVRNRGGNRTFGKNLTYNRCCLMSRYINRCFLLLSYK